MKTLTVSIIVNEGFWISIFFTVVVIFSLFIWDIEYHRHVKCGEKYCLEFNYPTFIERLINAPN